MIWDCMVVCFESQTWYYGTLWSWVPSLMTRSDTGLRTITSEGWNVLYSWAAVEKVPCPPRTSVLDCNKHCVFLISSGWGAEGCSYYLLNCFPEMCDSWSIEWNHCDNGTGIMFEETCWLKVFRLQCFIYIFVLLSHLSINWSRNIWNIFFKVETIRIPINYDLTSHYENSQTVTEGVNRQIIQDRKNEYYSDNYATGENILFIWL